MIWGDAIHTGVIQDDDYSAGFPKVPFCAYFERHELVLRYRPKKVGFNTIACIFKAITNVGNDLPIDAILDGFEVRRNVARRDADNLEQPLQSQPSHPIISERILRNFMQFLLNGVNRRQDMSEAIGCEWNGI